MEKKFKVSNYLNEKSVLSQLHYDGEWIELFSFLIGKTCHV